MVINTFRNAFRGAMITVLTFMSGAAFASDADMPSSINMPEGVTPISHDAWWIHMFAFWVCVAIGVVVFGLMIWSIIFHRKSVGHKSVQFHDNTFFEVTWTIVPFIILIALAIPAAKGLVRIYDTSEPDMTVKITGFQWKWQYDYLQDGFSYFSMLAADSNAASRKDSGIDPASVPHYLRDVDHPLVVPTGEKIRLLITSDDVIHSWYVPDFAEKTDAIPGFVNQAWIEVEKPGVYRGACTELCGRWHGFMPIVVVAETRDDYQKWVAAVKAGGGAYINPQTLEPEQNGSPVVFTPAELNFNAPTVTVPAAAPASAAPVSEKKAVVAPAGKKPAAAAPGWDMQTAMARGKQVFDQNCAACHMADGKGNPAMSVPAIAGGPIPNGPLAAHISLVLHGKGIMPAWGNILTDKDLAAVITFERNAFGNHTGDLVTPARIKAAR
ncbi:MAG TPA: cytochrome c oxidase subunit II [Gammaproteobacteria bacterium]|nr:cytochrome c oxidase subunit II [Gammaproteobacteria bacterium]